MKREMFSHILKEQGIRGNAEYSNMWLCGEERGLSLVRGCVVKEDWREF